MADNSCSEIGAAVPNQSQLQHPKSPAQSATLRAVSKTQAAQPSMAVKDSHHNKGNVEEQLGHMATTRKTSDHILAAAKKLSRMQINTGENFSYTVLIHCSVFQFLIFIKSDYPRPSRAYGMVSPVEHTWQGRRRSANFSGTKKRLKMPSE